MDDTIYQFRGAYAFLSNFYRAWFTTPKGHKVPTVEHLFQASKTVDKTMQTKILRAYSPAQAKALGRTVTLRHNWQDVKYGWMLSFVRWKFEQNEDLAQLLIDTEDRELIEGNTWHDNYWGACTCLACRGTVQHNALGIILMQVRDELTDEARRDHYPR